MAGITDEIAEHQDEYGAFLAEEREAELAEAEAAGLTIVEATSRTLLIDLDDDAAFEGFRQAWETLRNQLPYVGLPQVTASKSGLPHRHVIIHLANEHTAYERMLLQALLGSDIKRERANYRWTLYDCPKPIVFFELPGIQPLLPFRG